VLRDFLKHPLCRATKIFPPHFFFCFSTPLPPLLRSSNPPHTHSLPIPLLSSLSQTTTTRRTAAKREGRQPTNDQDATEGRPSTSKTRWKAGWTDAQDVMDTKTGRTDSRTQQKGTWRTAKHMGGASHDGRQDATARLARVRTCALSPSENFFNAFAIPTIQSEASMITC